MKTTEAVKLKPVIYDFTDYRVFLKAAYDFEKAHGDFSYAKFAERAGFKARSFLRVVMMGKRNLSVEAIAKFIVGIGLPFHEGEAFKALVQFNQAFDFESRKQYWELFLKLHPKNHPRQRVEDEYLYLARMAYPVLLILLRQPHLKHDLESLSRMTSLKPVDVEEGIKTLIQLGAVREIDSGKYIVTAEGFVTSNDTPSVARQTFHANMLDKAKQALNLDPLLREFQSMMVPLNKEEFLYLKGRVRALVQEVDQKFGGKRPQSERAYALNINLIPITPDFIRAEKSVSQKLGSEEENTEEVYS